MLADVSPTGGHIPRRWFRLAVLALMLLTSAQARAVQNDIQNYQDPDNWTDTKDGPPEASPTCFLANPSQFEHDCIFRNNGPIIINVPVTRYVGDVDKLKPQGKRWGMIQTYAEVRISCFDIDFNEVDSVYVNGYVAKPYKLGGANCIWTAKRYEVPIEAIKFPQARGSGAAPTPRDNEVKIVIDTSSPQAEYCTAIDWVAIEIKVASPLVLIHGALALEPGGMFGSTWRDANRLLPTYGLPVDESYNQGIELNRIEENAAAIKTVVDRVKTETGTDKVSLIMHSKGGLDGRAFVDNGQASIVDKFVQLGSPNGGLPWLDGIMVGATATNPANLVLKPGDAGWQLTVLNMLIFNLFHHIQSGPSYMAIAGDHDPGCTFCLQRAMLQMYGPGDVWVPIWSAHALAGAETPTQSGSGPTSDNMYHAYLSGAPILRDNYFVPKAAVFAAASRIGATNTEYGGMQCSQPWEGSITAGHPDSAIIAIDHARMASIGLFYASGTFDVTLRAPDGQIYTRNSVAGSPSASWSEVAIPGGWFGAFTFYSPMPGQWTAIINPQTIGDPSGLQRVALQAWYADPDFKMDLVLRKGTIAVGDTLVLNAVMKRSSAPETGATVTGLVSVNDGTASSINLLDTGASPDSAAGDGIYSARAIATQAGGYGIKVRASGGGGAVPAYSRAKVVLGIVSQGKISGTPTIRSYRAVQNPSGFSKWLQTESDLTIPATGTYRVYAELLDGAGQTTTAQTETLLTAGARTVRFRFAGNDLFEHRQNGPWTLSTLRIAQATNGLLAPVGEWANCHQTSAYSYASFQRPAIRLSGTVFSSGVDSQTGSPGYEYLDVLIGVEVDYPGLYQWSGTLVDDQGREIGAHGQFEGSVDYADTLAFRFSGGCIRRNGVDGPFTLKDVVISRQDVPVLFVEGPLTTSFHRASEFAIETLGATVYVEDDSISVCPGGDLDTFRMKVVMPHPCPMTAMGQAPNIYAVKYPSAIVVWDSVTPTDVNGDTLRAYAVTTGTLADTAWFQAAAISGCETVFGWASGLLYYNVYWDGQLIAISDATWLMSLDLDRRAGGSVDRWDLDRYQQLNLFPSPADCNNYDWDNVISLADDAIFNYHYAGHHHAPRHLFSPSGGENYHPGDQMHLAWLKAHGDSARVTLSALRKYVPSYKRAIATNLIDTGAYTWTVPSDLPLTSDLLVEVEHTAGVYIPAYGDVGRDTSDAAWSFNASGGGCPTLDILAGGEWRTENTILGRAPNGEYLSDNYHMSGPPDAENSSYVLRIREDEQEETTLDNVILAAVDHAPGVSAVPDGASFLIGRLEPATRVVDAFGRDLTQSLADGGSGIALAAGDTLTIDLAQSVAAREFATESVRQSRVQTGGGGFVMSSMGKELPPDELRTDNGMRPTARLDAKTIDEQVLSDTGLLLQVPDGSGGWTTVDHEYPRDQFAESVFDSIVSDRIRVIAIGAHRIRYLGRVIPVEGEAPTVTRWAPISATHTRLGDVRSAVSYQGGGTTDLVPGDTLNLRFTATAVPNGKVRDVFFVSHGVYSALPNGVSGSAAPRVSAVFQFALGQARPNPSTGRVTFGYTLASSTKAVLRLYSVAGRLVRTVIQEQQEGGPHEAIWDGTDDNGARSPAGVYFYRLQAGDWSSERKLVVIQR